jgi:putative pyruvate formate lyase activating enzyme
VKLQEVGNVHGIDSVPPEHVVVQVNLSILHAKMLGMMLYDGVYEDKC